MQAKRWVNAVYKPGSLQKAIGLQIEAFWQRHGNKVFAALGLFGVYLLWSVMNALWSSICGCACAAAQGFEVLPFHLLPAKASLTS